MKIAILAAMDKEMSLLLNVIENPRHCCSEGLEYYEGRIGDHEIVAAKCGIGKVNACLHTAKIIEAAHPELVINIGVAGGASASMPIGRLLVATHAAYHDVWCGPGTEPGQADGFPRLMESDAALLSAARDVLADDCTFGLICTGDVFVASHEEIIAIRKKFPDVKAVDMESAAIAQTCIDRRVKWAILRVVSDTPGEGENLSQYQNFWTDAPAATFEAVKRLLRVI